MFGNKRVTSVPANNTFNTQTVCFWPRKKFNSSLCLGSVTASEELTSKKTHKIVKYLPKEKTEVNFIYLAYSRSQFGIKRCKIQYFMEHFLRSAGTSRGQSLQITVNVWDQIARTVTLTSHGLKHRALSACGVTFERKRTKDNFHREM